MKLTEDNYVECAEKVIVRLKDKKDEKGKKINIVSTSKLRNLLAMTAEIYNEAVNCQTDRLSTELIGRINYLKIRFLYEAGREPSVRALVVEADIIACIDEIRGDRARYILFSRYIEALVAYRKFLVEKDD